MLENDGPLNSDDRVVVTGIGVISSIGNGKDAFWSGLLKGVSGISEIDAFSVDGLGTKYGGQVKNFSPASYLKKESSLKVGRASQLASSAARLACSDASLNENALQSGGVSVVMGTTMGESQILEEIDKKIVDGKESEVFASDVDRYPGNVLAVNVATELGIIANCTVIPTACAAGNYAIGYGFDQIKSGSAQIALVGGCDAFSRIALTGFSRMFAVAPERCQPFDKNRKGILVGEGAGVVVLERLSNALSRGAQIYAELLGYALTCDASHMTIPEQQSISLLIKKALKNANIKLNDVDYISAHGTGTRQNDKTESQAIREVFGDKTDSIPVSSIKSMLGHSMGAASALEAIACTMAIKTSNIPPTINYETLDPECGIDCVPNRARSKSVNIALNNSYAFGGNNACVAFGRLSQAGCGVR